MTKSNSAFRAADPNADNRKFLLHDGRSVLLLPEDDSDLFLVHKYDVSAYEGAFSALGLGPDQAWIAASLAHTPEGIWTSYSRNNNYYSASGIGTRTRILGSISRLAEKQLITNIIQLPSTPIKGKRRPQSIMCANPELRKIVTSATRGASLPIARPEHVIELRDRDTKEALPYEFSDEILTMRRSIQEQNEAIMTANLPHEASACMRRIFSGNMNSGGRFYCNGSSWQNMKKDERKEITISGEPVVEIDYKAIHPSMLYIISQVPVPLDCHSIPGWEHERDLVKFALLVLINAKEESHARRRMRIEAEKYGLPGAAGDAILDAIQKHHTAISHYFYSDIGVTLQYHDSQIADRVLHLLRERGIVALPVHDSFLVAQSNGTYLEAAMHQAAAECGFSGLRVEWK